MGFSQGLFDGKGQAMIRVPTPLRLTRRLWSRSQSWTAWLTCQPALSQTISNPVLPAAQSRSAHHARNWVVTALTGRPSTKRNQTRLVSGSKRP
jgi:hypothetical protein